MASTWGDHLLQMFAGLGNSLLISVIGIVAALLLGSALGALRYSCGRVVNAVIGGYVNLFRCTPFIVQIFVIYYALPEVGILLTPFNAGWIALALWGAAYQTETFRAGYRGVPSGEITAARALGMSGWQTFSSVTLPIALRTSIPSATTTAISQFRQSAFMLSIGYMELTAIANRIVTETFQVFQVFGVAALMYLTVCTLISYGSRLFERAIRIPGLGVAR